MPPTDNDLGNLRKFIELAESDLEDVVNNWEAINPATEPPEFVNLMRNAWEEIKNEGYFKKILEALRPKKPEQKQELEERLYAAGLYGSQLEFKLACHKYYRERFFETFEALKGSPLLGWIKDRVKSFLRDLLDLINLILTSLKDAIPFVELIKEFKDLIKKKLED